MTRASTDKWHALFFCILALAAGLFFLGAPGTKDTALIHTWFVNLSQNSLADGYKAKLVDYPPLFFFTIYPFKWISTAQWGEAAAVKVSVLFFLYFTTFVFYRMTRDLPLTVLFFCALFIDTAILKYIDINYTPFLLLAFICLKQQRYGLFSLLYTVSFLVKWQPLILSPFLAIYIIHHGRQQYSTLFLNRIFLQTTITSIAVIVFVLTLFGSFSVLLALAIALNGGFYLCGDALNLHWITTWLMEVLDPVKTGGLEDGYRIHNIMIIDKFWWLWVAKIPFITAFTATAIAFAFSKKTFNDLVYYCFIGYSIYFTLNAGVHENHLFVVVVLAFLLASINRDYRHIAILMAVYFNINLLLFEGFGDGWYAPDRNVLGMDITLPVAVLFTTCNSVFLYRHVMAALRQNKPEWFGLTTAS